MKRIRLAAVGFAILLFGSGVVVGALGHRYYETGVVNAKSSPDSYRQRYVGEMRSRLKLTPEQVQQLEAIMAGTKSRFKALRDASRPQMSEIKRQHVEKVKAMLTPEQLPVYEQLVAEHERRAHEAEQRDR
jgi:hypothetical protein